MRIADGYRIDVVAPDAGLKKDQPVRYGALLIVPNLTAKAGHVVSCTYRGLYDGPIKAGDAPQFVGEPAYFDGTDFTKTQPAVGAGAITSAVGAFIDGGVLLFGAPVTATSGD